MFAHLRTKLTLLYAGLFGLVLVGIAGSLYPLISARALETARRELRATASVFDRIEALRLSQLRENASISATDFGFKSAAAAAVRDPVTVSSALANTKRRLRVDMAYLVLPDGQALTESAGAAGRLPASLFSLLDTSDTAQGALVLNSDAYRAVAVPVQAPDLIGWLLVGTALDDREMASLASLAAIPLDADLLVRRGGDWMRAAVSAEPAVDPNEVGAPSGREAAPSPRIDAIVEMRPIASIDGSDVRLQLSYPTATALAPMRALLGLLLGVGLIGLAVLAVAAWLLARSITRPLAMLEAATRRVEEGDYSPVSVKSRDEIGRLANGFNLMTSAIEERTRTITHLALHDRETDLPNREHLERQIGAITVDSAHIFVGVIGIDRFGQIRDAIGYTHAGSLIAKLGERLRACDALSRPARLSADLIGVAFAAGSDDAAECWLLDALAALEQPVEIGHQRVDVSATAGFARLSLAGASGQSVIERASIALDQARKTHRKAIPFNADAYGDPIGNLSLMGDMLRALSNGDIFLAHQPKLNLRSGEIDGVEALVRWRHPERGTIRPDLFVPMAEETGHIRALTDFVLAQAVQDQATLAAAGWPLQMSVNISGRLLGDAAFAQTAKRLLSGAQGTICFEITETAVMDDPVKAMEQLRAFSVSGVPISIDDYGSGLSSLAYLKMLPAQELKIDRGLLAGLASNARDAFLLRSTVDLGHGLGMKVTAEGVEDPATLAIIQSIGCDRVQGFLIAKPLTLPELIRFLNDEASWRKHTVRATA